MKIKFLTETLVSGQKAKAGAVLDLATGEANLLLGMGKAEIAFEFDLDGEEEAAASPAKCPPRPPARKKVAPKAE